MNFKDRLKGCLIYGAIGDLIGGKYEGTNSNQEVVFDVDWSISDDTQLTLETCEAIIDSEKIDPEKVAARFLDWYNRRRLTGLGSSTLKYEVRSKKFNVLRDYYVASRISNNNMERYQNKYRIATSRLQNWDYGSNAAYFITICTHNRKCFFGEIAE